MQKNLKKLVDSSDERVAMAFTDLAFIAEAKRTVLTECTAAITSTRELPYTKPLLYEIT